MEIRDPLLKRLPVGADEEPPREEVVKGDQRTEAESVTGGPPAGRSSIDEARARGLKGWLQLLGPGLVTGASDDDPSGIGTYSQVGAQFGFGILWTAIFTFPLMVAVQELCGRIALATGVGLGTALKRKFPSALVAPSILLLVVANTINLGADLAAVASGGRILTGGHVPLALLIVGTAALLVVMQLTLSYATVFRIFKWLTLALFAYVIGVIVVHPSPGKMVLATFIPHIEFSRDFLLALVAVLGTTISPYLFFWQASSEVEEMRQAGKLTEDSRRQAAPVELPKARVDTVVGMFFSQLVMYCIIALAAAAFFDHGKHNIATADQAAQALAPLFGSFASIIFAVGIIGTGLLTIPILSGSAAYAVKEFMGFSGSLVSKPSYRPTFYAILVVAMLVGVAMNFIGLDPIAALFWSAVINGLVAPPLLVLIVLLGSDREQMREHVSGRLSRTVTWAATAVMAVAAVFLVVFSVRH